MKKTINPVLWICFGALIVSCLGFLDSKTNGEYFLNGDGSEARIVIRNDNQTANFMEIRSSTATLFNITSNGSVTVPQVYITGTTNMITFGGTNAAPAGSTNPLLWVGIQISGDTNTYRMGICK